jgi:hypothetical protein
MSISISIRGASHKSALCTVAAVILALICNLPIHAQTYRGGITGTVTDNTGAAITNANVSAVETATNTSYHAVSSSAGEFNFANLPVGIYTVTISFAGFSTAKYDHVEVAAGTSYTLPAKLRISSSA